MDFTFSRRNSMARAAKNIFVDHPVKGVGLGALAAVYPRYENTYDGLIVEHVHNDYLEGLAETGIAGGLCGFAFLWLLFGECRTSFIAPQGHFSRGLHAGAIAAVCGLLFHSLIDFNLHIFSNAVLFLVQVFLATSIPLPSQARTPRKRAPRASGSCVKNSPLFPAEMDR